VIGTLLLLMIPHPLLPMVVMLALLGLGIRHAARHS
jgi:hypothetical protein